MKINANSRKKSLPNSRDSLAQLSQSRNVAKSSEMQEPKSMFLGAQYNARRSEAEITCETCLKNNMVLVV